MKRSISLLNWALWLLSLVKGVGEIPFSPPLFWCVPVFPPAPLTPPVVALIADIGGGGGIGFGGGG